MARRGGLASLLATGSVGEDAAPPGQAPALPVVWTRLFKSVVSDDDLGNRFLVKVFPRNVQGGPVEPVIFGVTGADTIEDVCRTFFIKLGQPKIGHYPASCVFRTLEMKIIPAGSIMADLYKTNHCDNGVVVELIGSIMPYTPGNRYFISTP